MSVDQIWGKGARKRVLTPQRLGLARFASVKGTLTLVAVATAIGSWPLAASAQPAQKPPEKREAPPDARAPDPPKERAPAPSRDAGEPAPPDGEREGEEKPAPGAAPEEEPPKAGAAPPQEERAAPERPAAPLPGTAPPGESPQPLPPQGAAPGRGAQPSEQPRGPAPGTAQRPTGRVGLFPEPSTDARELREQGKRDKDKEDEQPGADRVFAEDWWTHARPAFEIHGYFRTRAELFHNFSLERVDPPNAALFPRPADDNYTAFSGGTEVGEFGPVLCTADETSASNLDSDNPSEQLFPCRNKTNAGANIRFRLNPELHVSDNVRVVSQIDILDNASLGSTPSGARFRPDDDGGYEIVPRGGFTPAGVFDDTIVPPQSAINSVQDSISVKRAWGEYATPMGELRFGRMPNHWGLGMVHNAGDGFDDDFQSTVDRIMFLTGFKPLDLYFGGAWDFPNEGPLSDTLPGGEPYDVAQLDDVNQWGLILMRKKSPQLVKQALANGKVVLNGGAYVLLRKQLLANDQSGDASTGAAVPDASREDLAGGFGRRGALIWLPDLWFQLRYKKFRFEAEWAGVIGDIESVDTEPGPVDFDDAGQKLRQFGLATEIEQLLVEDRLHLKFMSGWASGDPDVFSPGVVGNLMPGRNQAQINDDTASTFRFHPNYRVDLILHRYILNRVQGTYYFRPEVAYDFMRKPSGQRLGGGAGFTWSRASEFVQAPGHARDLGIELNAKLYFQSKDGALNDNLENMGGFYSMLQYGVLFPLAGLGYQSQEEALIGGRADTSAAQILRWYMGIMF